MWGKHENFEANFGFFQQTLCNIVFLAVIRFGQNNFLSDNHHFGIKYFLKYAGFLTKIHRWKAPNVD